MLTNSGDKEVSAYFSGDRCSLSSVVDMLLVRKQNVANLVTAT